MTLALVTQLVEALESGLAYVENEANQLTTREYKTAITAAREYLATEPTPTLTEKLAQQGIKLRTEFEPKQRDSELATEPSGERAELIARLVKQWAELDPVDPYRADIGKAADMLEADAQQAKRVPLAGDEIEKIADGCRAGAGSVWPHAFARALEAHHKILPTEKPTDWSAA